MKLAVHFSNFSLPGDATAVAPALAETARAADQGGCSAMTVMDHWFQMIPLGGSEQPMLEGYTTLGYLAAITTDLELGTLVTGITYRHPALLAKIVTTLDVLSEGRAFLGIGAAWYEEEHDAYGVPFPPIADRFERLTETLEIVEQMWSDDDGPYAGKHYTLGATICVPKPIQQPRPPILIGGAGEKKTLRLVAEHADACNLFDAGADVVAHKIDVLKQHCADVGRNPSTVRITLTSNGRDVFTDDFVRRMENYSALGVDQVWVSAQMPDPAGWTTEVCDRVLPRLQALEPAAIG